MDSTWGIRVDYSDGNLLRGNTVRNCDSCDIILEDTNETHVESNLIANDGFGLAISGSAQDTLLRSSTARGNSTDFGNGSASTTSHGDNYMPTQM